MSTGSLNGGSIRILWDATTSATVTITGVGAVNFTVGGAGVTFPYTLSASTTFDTDIDGDYTVSVLHQGFEVANTPDGIKPVRLANGGQLVFAPSPDSQPDNKFVTSLSTTYGVKGESGNHGLNLAKMGWVLRRGTAGQWDEGLVESPVVWWSDITQRWEMVYVGYAGTTAAPINPKVGHAYSTDLLNWTKNASNPIFTPSGIPGAPDENGVTGPFVFEESGTYHLFYIGLTGTGYEGGIKRQCHATATSLTGPWTRTGSIIAPAGSGWRADAIWHPHVVKVGGTYYNFFNASSGSVETIGYATAGALAGPWTVDDTNSPLINVGAGGQWDAAKVIDPALYRVGNTWFMAYGGYDGTNSQDGVAFTSTQAFPLGWTKHSANPVLTIGNTNQPDNLAAAKPFIVQQAERHYHFYTAADVANTERGIRLAISPARYEYVLVATDEPSTTRTTTSTSYVTQASTTALWVRTDRPKAQMRALIRANPNNATLSYNIMNGFSAAVLYTGTMTGSTWTDALTPWFDVPEDTSADVFRTYFQMKTSSGAITVSLGNTLYEFRWPTA